MASTDSLPDIAEILLPVLQRVPVAQQPLLISLAERLAADRYRTWAREVTDDAQSANLYACAEREEEIARRVEGLYPDAEAVQQRIVAEHPDLEEINRSLFADRPLVQQFTIQARGERLGAATWRSFAAHATDPAVRDVFHGCATLEEESAVCLEKIVGA